MAPSTLFLCFAVDDVAAAAERVRQAGGTATEPHEEPYGLVSDCADDQGGPLALFEVEGAGGSGSTRSPGLVLTGQGDLAYVTMEVADSARARAFYGSVLGWTFAAGHAPDGWQVEGDVVPPVGLSGGHGAAVNVPMYRVDDIAVSVQRVREGGGTATDPEQQPYGISSVCADDQGTRFYLGQL
jgi:predicted enzyme related to lactoylglutathione lyase